MRRRNLWPLLIAAFAVTVVSGLLTMALHQQQTGLPGHEKQSRRLPSLMIDVYLTASQKVVRVPIEAYIRGVVAAEMPADFAMEALKAQAIAARTYIIKRLVDGDFSDVPADAVVSDSIQHQAYKTDEALRQDWGLVYAYKINRIKAAVEGTEGQVIIYHGRPIEATFFSTSNGYTESAADYWGQDVPYLQSVPSPWDKTSPQFEAVTQIPAAEVAQKMQVDLAQAVQTPSKWVNVIDWTQGHRVKDVLIGGKRFSGRDVRERLGLRSSDFKIDLYGTKALIQTRGYGHGVGMSQYGADGMAKEGKTAEEIIKYYYKGVEIADYRQWLKTDPSSA